MKGGLMILATPKSKGVGMHEEEEAPEGAEEESSAGDELAGEAFDALKAGDREGFAAAFKAAVQSCMNKSESYSDDEE